MAANSFALAEAYLEIKERGASKADATIGKLRKQTEMLQEGFNRAAVHARRLFVVGAVAAAGFVHAAANAEEVTSKFNAVFKDQTVAARKWSDDFAKSLNRSRFSVERYMSSFQDTFVPMGFARTEATELSKQLTRLTLDLSSFNNVDAGEAAQLLTSALVGNHEAVRRFGVIITEATLEQELFRMGIKGGTRAASELQKVQARLNLVMQMTTDAQGDAARTANSTANQIKALRDQFFDMSVEVGNSLIPVAKQLLPVLMDWAKWVGKIAQEYSDSIPTITKWTAGITASLVVIPQAAKAVRGLAAAMELLGVATKGATIAFMGKAGLVIALGWAAFTIGKEIGKALADLVYGEKEATKAAKEFNAALLAQKNRAERVAAALEKAKAHGAKFTAMAEKGKGLIKPKAEEPKFEKKETAEASRILGRLVAREEQLRERAGAAGRAFTEGRVSKETALAASAEWQAAKAAADDLGKAIADAQTEWMSAVRQEEEKARRKRREELDKEGESLRLAVRKPMEEFQDRLNRLKLLLAEGAITQETFNRAEALAKAKMKGPVQAAAAADPRSFPGMANLGFSAVQSHVQSIVDQQRRKMEEAATKTAKNTAGIEKATIGMLGVMTSGTMKVQAGYV